MPSKRPDLAEKILKARHALHGRLQDPDYAGLVEPFNVDRYNREPVGRREPAVRHAGRQGLRRRQPRRRSLHADGAAASSGSTSDLLRMGLSIAETMVELFSGLSPDNPLFEQYSFISADELPNVRLLLQRLGGKGVEAVPEADRVRLMTLPLPLHRGAPSPGPDRCRHGRPPAGGAARLRAPACRRRCAVSVEFYDFERYNSAATLQDNILFGRLVYGQAQADQRIGTLISEVLDELGLRDSVIEVGLDYNVGVGGKRLAGDPAAEARHRPGADQAAAIPGGQRGGRGVRRPHTGQNP